MKFLSNSMSTSSNLPASVIWTEAGGGADTRRDLGIAARVIGAWQQALAAQFKNHYIYVIETAYEQGDLTYLPPDYENVEWQFPKDLTIDGGREQAQDRADVFAGLMTLQEYYGRWSLGWRQQIEQVAIEQAYIREMAKKYGLEPYDIQLRDPNLLSKVYAPDSTTPSTQNA